MDRLAQEVGWRQDPKALIWLLGSKIGSAALTRPLCVWVVFFLGGGRNIFPLSCAVALTTGLDMGLVCWPAYLANAETISPSGSPVHYCRDCLLSPWSLLPGS